jgi:outer membrane receptor protein involved in Fe transport
VRLALASGAATSAMCSAVAIAQEQPADEAEIGSVVVTGSRIPQPNLTSISPVTAVSAESIRIEGITRVEDLINNLPQAFADFGGNLSNGATGAATVNLRGLGAQRTLVLVNGRRLMPGDPTQNGNATADLNQIPGALIQRIEVLTGGASAVYGADAVAGVVNFIMNDNFEGVKVDAQYGFYQHDNDNDLMGGLLAARSFDAPDSSVRDGYNKDITFVMGMNTADGRGNATVYAGYREIDGLLQSERDYSACAINPTAAGGIVCGGSGTSSPAQLGSMVQSGPNAGAPVGSFVTNPDGSLRPFTASDQYNFAPTNYYYRPDERYTAGLFAHYDVSQAAQAYTEFMFMDDQTLAQIAPAGLFLNGGPGIGSGYLVNCNNPFMSAAQVQEFCLDRGLSLTDIASIDIGKRNVEGGGRLNDIQHTSYRGIVGVRGELGQAWSYDVYGQYGTTEFSNSYFNDFSITRGGRALIAVDDGTGNIVCGVNADADPANNDPACVPYDVFSAAGPSAAALNYVQIPGFQTGYTKETVVSGSFTGDLGAYGLQLPTATTGLGVAFGAEYRREESQLRNDLAFATGDLSGQGGATLDSEGAYDVQDLFAEVRLPIIEGRTFAQALLFEAGYRYSDYSLDFTTDTYKFGLDWAPVEDVRLRGSFQRAVRAPNIQELFRPQVLQLDGNTDPCAGPNPVAGNPLATEENCAFTGVLPGQYGNIQANPAAQYNGITGGNPNLDPESSDTTSFGLVFTPRFLENFSLSIDYFDISVEDVIGPIGADLILNTCLATQDPSFCGLIQRAPGSGDIWSSQGFVVDTTFNLGSLSTKGIDMEANYRFEIGGAGELSVQLIGTYLDELVTEPLPGFPTYDCAGLYGTVCVTPSPEWRHKFRTTWMSPWDLDVTLTWRHLDEVFVDGSVANPNFPSGFVPPDEKLAAQDYLDLAAAYRLELGPSALTMRLGINNLTDEEPPLVTQATCPSVFCSGNTFPQVYDTLGRTVFFNVTADF